MFILAKQSSPRCEHKETKIVIVPDDEDDNGTVLDGVTQRVCENPHCKKVVEVLA
jgi:hypothetical protein